MTIDDHLFSFIFTIFMQSNWLFVYFVKKDNQMSLLRNRAPPKHHAKFIRQKMDEILTADSTYPKMYTDKKT